MLEAKLDTSSKMALYGKTIREGNLTKISQLLSKGADIDSTDKFGRTALWWGAFNGNLELVIFLIERKAKIDIPDKFGKKPLDIALELALGGHREPGEHNVYSEIIAKLRQATEELYREEIEGVTEKIAKLGIHGKSNKTNKINWLLLRKLIGILLNSGA